MDRPDTYPQSDLGDIGITNTGVAAIWHWWDEREVLASVLAFAIDAAEITDLDDARYFVEKPWKYDELYEAWLADPEWGGDPK